MIIKSLPLTLCLILAFASSFFAQQNEQERGWNKPVAPFKIAGNIYYVGASDITSYLITTPKGHILIDSGFIETVPQIKENIAKLGFKLADVKILLNSHAHYDHAGGLAELRRLTNAKLLVSQPDFELMSNGGKGDPNFGDRFPFEPTKADATFTDGKNVTVGGTVLRATLTPGHTRGCTTWSTDVTENRKKLSVVFVCSTSAPGYKLVGNEKYPTIWADYSQTFERLEKMKADIFLGSHGNIYDLQDKIQRLRAGTVGNPFIDPTGYREYISESRSSIQNSYKRQAEQQK